MKHIIIHCSYPFTQQASHKSHSGHMWFTIVNGSVSKSYGYAPGAPKHPEKKAWVYEDDDIEYINRWDSNPIIISNTEYQQLKNFVEEITLNTKNIKGRFSVYDGVSSNCVTFTYAALNAAGIIHSQHRHSWEVPILEVHAKEIVLLNSAQITYSAYQEAIRSSDYEQINNSQRQRYPHSLGIRDWTSWGNKGFSYWKPVLMYELRENHFIAPRDFTCLNMLGYNNLSNEDTARMIRYKNDEISRILAGSESDQIKAHKISAINQRHLIKVYEKNKQCIDTQQNHASPLQQIRHPSRDIHYSQTRR